MYCVPSGLVNLSMDYFMLILICLLCNPYTAMTPVPPQYHPPAYEKDVSAYRSLSYSRRELLALRRTSCGRSPTCTTTPGQRPTVLDELSAVGLLRYRGRRGGVSRKQKVNVECRSTRAICQAYRQADVVHRRILSVSRVTTTVTPALHRSAVQPPLIYLLNATSICKAHALQNLQVDLEAYNVDVCLITESWLKQHHVDQLFLIQGYNLIRRDRRGRKGGGVCMYISNRFNYNVFTPTNDDSNFEVLWARVTNCLNSSCVYYISSVYYPPKTQLYTESELLDFIDSSVKQIESLDSNAAIVIAGDFNQIPNNSIENIGLLNIVNVPTHLGHFLDRIYCSRVMYQHVKAVKASVFTKHSAVIASPSIDCIQDFNKTRSVASYRKHTPNQMSKFLTDSLVMDWSNVFETDDLQKSFDQFYNQVNTILDFYFPLSKVTLTSRDPPHITPRIKSILRARNRLMRAGSLEKAAACTDQVSRLIAKTNSKKLARLSGKTAPKILWNEVNDSLNRGNSIVNSGNSALTASTLNSHYAAVSADSLYSEPTLKSTCSAVCEQFNELSVLWLLEHIKDTAAGPDGLPAWFLRLAAPAIAQPLAWLYNQSLAQGVVPTQWKSAIITPVPKIQQPLVPADFRPISVTPILSRCLERFIVKNYFYPVFSSLDHASKFNDQFAFRPTGSTTAALTTILQTLTEFLEYEPYVCVYALDFSKAFDTVRNCKLLSRVLELGFPDFIYNWLCNFLTGRSHSTKWERSVSSCLTFNAGVVQGSAIGPAAYVVCASELQPKFSVNRLFKYADDSYLLVPASNIHTVNDELDHIVQWSHTYNLKLNISKCKEMVVSSPHHSLYGTPPDPGTVAGVERVQSLVILGINISDKLSMQEHIKDLTTASNQSMFALRTLKRCGLADEAIWAVCRATLIAKILYGSSAWLGFVNKTQINCLDGIIRRAVNWGLYPKSGPALQVLTQTADRVLFQKVLNNSNHVMNPLLPPIKVTPYNLRPRAHDRVLPLKTSSLAKNFLYRMLFSDLQ
jgi:hypothetical protein